VPDNAAPQEGQLRLFSVTAVEQAGHLFIEPVSYDLSDTDLNNFDDVKAKHFISSIHS
jgi:hypothetical protein